MTEALSCSGVTGEVCMVLLRFLRKKVWRPRRLDGRAWVMGGEPGLRSGEGATAPFADAAARLRFDLFLSEFRDRVSWSRRSGGSGSHSLRGLG